MTTHDIDWSMRLYGGPIRDWWYRMRHKAFAIRLILQDKPVQWGYCPHGNAPHGGLSSGCLAHGPNGLHCRWGAEHDFPRSRP